MNPGPMMAAADRTIHHRAGPRRPWRASVSGDRPGAGGGAHHHGRAEIVSRNVARSTPWSSACARCMGNLGAMSVIPRGTIVGTVRTFRREVQT